MLFKRVQLVNNLNGGLPAPARQGDGFVEFLDTTVVATDSNITLTVADMSPGVIQYTGFTAGRNLTTPTAALILAAAPDMDIGDTFTFLVSITVAFAGTWVAGTGVTLAGRATTPASSSTLIVVKKLSSTTVEWRVM